MDRNDGLDTCLPGPEEGIEFLGVKSECAGVNIDENSPRPGQRNRLNGRGKGKRGCYHVVSRTYPLPPQGGMEGIGAGAHRNTMLYAMKTCKIPLKLRYCIAENKLRAADDFRNGIIDFLLN